MCVVNVFRKLGKGFLYPFSLFSYPETSTLRCLRRSSRNLHPTGKITNFYVNQRVFSKKTAFTAHFLTKREKWHTPHSENPHSDLDFNFNLNFNLNIF